MLPLFWMRNTFLIHILHSELFATGVFWNLFEIRNRVSHSVEQWLTQMIPFGNNYFYLINVINSN